MNTSDKTTYAPFILRMGETPSLILADFQMIAREDVFKEKNREGNGYDWTSVARTLLKTKLSGLVASIKFDSEAGMFSAIGSVEDLKQLAAEMKKAFDDENILREILAISEAG